MTAAIPVRRSIGHQPMYARLLRLRNLSPSGFLCFAFLEGSVALGILLALAELVSWWGVLVLPATVAGMVKLNDTVAGLVTRPATPASVAGAGRRKERSRVRVYTGPPGEGATVRLSIGGRAAGSSPGAGAGPDHHVHEGEVSDHRGVLAMPARDETWAAARGPAGPDGQDPARVGRRPGADGAETDRRVGADSEEMDRRVGALGLAGVGGLAGANGLLSSADASDRPGPTGGRRRGRQTRAAAPVDRRAMPDGGGSGTSEQLATGDQTKRLSPARSTRAKAARAIGSSPVVTGPAGSNAQAASTDGAAAGNGVSPAASGAGDPVAGAVGRRPAGRSSSARRQPDDAFMSAQAGDDSLSGQRPVGLRRHTERSSNAPAAAADTNILNGPRVVGPGPEQLDTQQQRERQSGSRRYE